MKSLKQNLKQELKSKQFRKEFNKQQKEYCDKFWYKQNLDDLIFYIKRNIKNKNEQERVPIAFYKKEWKLINKVLINEYQTL